VVIDVVSGLDLGSTSETTLSSNAGRIGPPIDIPSVDASGRASVCEGAVSQCSHVSEDVAVFVILVATPF
jgi:hypothetical protein